MKVQEVYSKSQQEIREFSGRIIGTIYVLHNGDKQARDFYGRIVGTYDHVNDVTRDFYGRVIARGDALALALQRARRNK